MQRFWQICLFLPRINVCLLTLFLGLYSCFRPFFCWLERHVFWKMPVNLIQYRGTVEIFNNQHFVFGLRHKSQSLLIHTHSNVVSHYACFFHNSFLLLVILAVFLTWKLNSCKGSNNSPGSTFLVAVINIWLATWFYRLLLLLSGDVELNLGPKRNSSDVFSICHRNLNSMSAHSYAKVFLLKAYISIHKFDIICITETYLYSITPSNDSHLEICGYILVHSDHPSNNNRKGSWIYYKNFLPLRILNVQYLQESICFELKPAGKTCNFLSLYRSPSQSQDDFETFIENLELNLENSVQRNPFLVAAIRDFNAKSSNYFCQDKNNFEEDATEHLTSQFGLHQVIKQQTHILDISSSYIDLILMS